MSDLIVIAFKDEHRATEMLTALRRMEAEHLVDLEDAVVVVRNKDGKVRLQQTYDLTASGAASGAFWGLLIGFLFSIPTGGVLLPFFASLAGAAGGALSGKLSDIGINDDFIKEIGTTITPSTSALFLLVRSVTSDKVLPELRQYGGTVLQTSLSNEAETELRESLKTEAEKVLEAQQTQQDSATN